MTSFKFLHAADLHLDSPLLGLASKSPEFAQRVEDASRQAFDNLVDLAITEDCQFVVLAGDVFDGELRNMRAGLFFVDRLQKLAAAGIKVFMVLGNHDAENRFVSKLRFSDNVHVFSTRKAETCRLEDIAVAIHGRSFPQREVSENLAQTYPAPVPNVFNIGVLHTACIGREGYHAAYAPCSVEQLANHGYSYWALGHVHARAVLSEDPHIVYPGNLQGRTPRETGAKGVTLVEVRDGRVATIEHRALDLVRWVTLEVDLGSVDDAAAVLSLVRESLQASSDAAEGRALAVRLILTGATPLHGELQVNIESMREEIVTICAGMAEDVWLERVALRTSRPLAVMSIDPSIAGQIEQELRSVPPAVLQERLEKRLTDVAAKMPASARLTELLERLRTEAPARAVDLATALVLDQGAAGAPD